MLGAASVSIGEAMTFPFGLRQKSNQDIWLEYGIDYVEGKRNKV